MDTNWLEFAQSTDTQGIYVIDTIIVRYEGDGLWVFGNVDSPNEIVVFLIGLYNAPCILYDGNRWKAVKWTSFREYRECPPMINLTTYSKSIIDRAVKSYLTYQAQ